MVGSFLIFWDIIGWWSQYYHVTWKIYISFNILLGRERDFSSLLWKYFMKYVWLLTLIVSIKLNLPTKAWHEFVGVLQMDTQSVLIKFSIQRLEILIWSKTWLSLMGHEVNGKKWMNQFLFPLDMRFKWWWNWNDSQKYKLIIMII